MGQIMFKRKNKVTARNVTMWRIAWEYICWTLAGKPHNHVVGHIVGEHDEKK